MTGAALEAEKRELRQLAGVQAYTLWLSLYADDPAGETAELGALLSRNGHDLRLAAADLLDGVIDGAETIRRLKVEGELDVEFSPATYADKAARLRAQVATSAAAGRKFGPPLAGILAGRSDVPQAFRLSDSQQAGGLPDREAP
ncbi:hypothetical protein [Deinococcus aquiradiocola]|uniref:Uncharacterized protein n=1 Tax=Deinococcus aquiradiocola TaxID=393059 RepID=A0A917UKZ5_9DEIO|nr:hypothetical protein [Deinococcus aquiradiocola]GGJ65323.1 hypothetical protein GCM10008939_06560 [Deinococcus aquiradiocola]